jgi:hypothetical protein
MGIESGIHPVRDGRQKLKRNSLNAASSISDEIPAAIAAVEFAFIMTVEIKFSRAEGSP